MATPQFPPPLLTSPVAVTLKSYASGRPLEVQNFALEPAPRVDAKAGLRTNDVLIQPVYLSIDTNQYFHMEPNVCHRFGVPLLALGEPVVGYGVAYVLDSHHDRFARGDVVIGLAIPWQSWAVVRGGHGLTRLVGPLCQLPLQWHVGVLGMHAFTAWYGLTQIANPKPGEKLLITVATGGVGQMVVQLGGILGLDVVAVVGSNLKLAHLKQSPYVTDAFNYFAVASQSHVLSQVCPNGIDIFFDTVGGAFLDDVIINLNRNARVILGGLMSDHGLLRGPTKGIRRLALLSATNSSIHGFRIQDYIESHYMTFVQDMLQQIRAGQVTYELDLVQGLENAPKALVGVLEGRNLGKCVVQVSQDPPSTRERISPSRP
ncbi:hypothetical protein H4R35_000450 [Dimargaris xerosporica]|nr:hypothetical protein H4R35_000450 [Dimargaris xerosporica]